MKLTKKMLKSNKGFTIQDVAIAILAIALFAGVVGSTFVAVYKVQANTKVDATVTLYAIQVAEYLDKISYEEITKEKEASLEKQIVSELNIPDNYITLDLQIQNYESLQETETKDLVKTIKITFTYTFLGDTRNIILNRIKVKEK